MRLGQAPTTSNLFLGPGTMFNDMGPIKPFRQLEGGGIIYGGGYTGGPFDPYTYPAPYNTVGPLQTPRTWVNAFNAVPIGNAPVTGMPTPGTPGITCPTGYTLQSSGDLIGQMMCVSPSGSMVSPTYPSPAPVPTPAPVTLPYSSVPTTGTTTAVVPTTAPSTTGITLDPTTLILIAAGVVLLFVVMSGRR